MTVVFESPLGPVRARWNTAGELTTLWFREVRETPAAGDTDSPSPVWAEQLRDELADYFAGRRHRFTLALAPAGTPFQRRVWQALQTIPYGVTVTYGELAEQLGQPTASRAVGGANGRNPIAVVIPCHRVVAGNGLGGYTGGLDLKRWLLSHEGSGDALLGGLSAGV
jgi:methylated-DNA-[protein]-cysteine S-methyltransferase